jgi:hypothetical protein
VLYLRFSVYLTIVLVSIAFNIMMPGSSLELTNPLEMTRKPISSLCTMTRRHVETTKRRKNNSSRLFRSTDLRVMSPARFRCAMLLLTTHQYQITKTNPALLDSRQLQDMYVIFLPSSTWDPLGLFPQHYPFAQCIHRITI